MKTKTHLLILILTTCLFLFSACTNSSVDGNIIKADKIETEDNKEPINIGVIAPLTGKASWYGEPATNAKILAEKEINENGGILGRELNLIIEDGACDSKKSINSVNKLTSIDKVNVVLGGHCSTESLAIAPILNEKKVLQFASLTSSKDFTLAGDYSFRNMPTTQYYISGLGKIAYEDGARKIAIISENDEFSHSVRDSFKEAFKNEGGIIVEEYLFNTEEKDFSTYLLKMKELDIDSIFFATINENSAIDFFTQLHEMKLEDQWNVYANNGAITKSIYDKTNGKIKNILSTDVYVDPKNFKTKKMLDAYNEEYGEYPDVNNYFVTSSYDAVYLIKDAIEYCDGVNVECMKNFLYSTKDWEGSAGKLSFDENGDALSSYALHYFDSNGNEIWEVVE